MRDRISCVRGVRDRGEVVGDRPRRPHIAGMVAAELMNGFAERIGLTTTSAGGRRYLWTDAFAVRNFRGLARATADARYTDLALLLVDSVHGALGRHRDDDQYFHDLTRWMHALDQLSRATVRELFAARPASSRTRRTAPSCTGRRAAGECSGR